MNDLLEKKILLICPSFFGYELEIKNELVRLGAFVDYYNERPFTSSIEKILNRLNIKFPIKHKINNHYESILAHASKIDYDYLLVIAPETMGKSFIRKIKHDNPSIKTILYLWDSVANKRNSFNLIGEFDKVVTFDPNDASIDSRIGFLPLFYIPRYDKRNYNDEPIVETNYNVSFIGTAHSDRYKMVNNILDSLPLSSLTNFKYFYCPSKLLFFMKKTFSSELKGISHKEVSFKSLNSEKIYNVFAKSKFIIDIEHPKQKGLTMRTIEILGLQKKLITTNENVVNYDFYHPNNICIVDRSNPHVRDDFLCSDFTPLENGILDKYSLKQWLCNLLL